MKSNQSKMARIIRHDSFLSSRRNNDLIWLFSFIFLAGGKKFHYKFFCEPVRLLLDIEKPTLRERVGWPSRSFGCGGTCTSKRKPMSITLTQIYTHTHTSAYLLLDRHQHLREELPVKSADGLWSGSATLSTTIKQQLTFRVLKRERRGERLDKRGQLSFPTRQSFPNQDVITRWLTPVTYILWSSSSFYMFSYKVSLASGTAK